MKPPPLKSIFAGGLILSAIFGSFAYLEQRPLSVRVAAPQQNIAIEVFGLGTVEAQVLSKVGFKVAGTLVELDSDHGDEVAQGQILARIDPSEQDARVAKARAGIANSEAALRLAQTALAKTKTVLALKKQTNQRRQSLLLKNAISIESAEQAQMDEDISQADVSLASSEVEAATARLQDAVAQQLFEKVVKDQHVLKAPYKSVVIQRSKELGSTLVAGETIFTLASTETIWVQAYVDEARAGDIAVGQPATVSVRSRPGVELTGTVARVGLESDRVNEERRVYVSCDECRREFHLGEQAEVIIRTGTVAKGLFVPESAISFKGVRDGVVWVVQDGVLAKRSVKLGRRTIDARFEIAGDQPANLAVVISNADHFREGRSATLHAGQAR